MIKQILRIQTFITITLFGLLTTVLITQLVRPSDSFEIYFSVISGWVGIVIGFYFNKDITDDLRRRLRSSQRQVDGVKRKSRKVIDGLQGLNKLITDEYQSTLLFDKETKKKYLLYTNKKYK